MRVFIVMIGGGSSMRLRAQISFEPVRFDYRILVTNEVGTRVCESHAPNSAAAEASYTALRSLAERLGADVSAWDSQPDYIQPDLLSSSPFRGPVHPNAKR